MGIATFSTGTMVEIDNRPYKLLRLVEANLWQMEDTQSGRIKEATQEELNRQFMNHQLIFLSDRDRNLDPVLKEKRQQRETAALAEMEHEALIRMQICVSYVKAIEDLPCTERLMTQAIRQTWEKLGKPDQPPHWGTVQRWRKKYILHAHDGHALREQNFRKGNRTRRYCKEVLKFVEEAVEQVYLTRERKTVEETLNKAIVAVERDNRSRPAGDQLPLPTRRVIQAAIDAIDAFERHAARHGHQAAIRKYRSVLHMNVSNRPLECAEIDHTQLDLIVVDEETGMPLGRPWVTICIESYSRCILGLYISFTPPSYLTVARCLQHVFMPKVDLKTQFPEIEHDWVSYGVMTKLIVDNGMEFHSESLEALCLALGIDLQYTPRKTPWWKGKVERFIGTMNRGVAHGNPGTTFHNILEKDDYDPVKTAVISYAQLKLILHTFIVDVYHHKPHRSLDGMSPDTVWRNAITEQEIPLPDDPTRLEAILGRVDQRVLTHKGIEYEGLFYNSPELAGLRRRLGDKLTVQLRIDDSDLSHLHVLAPDNSTIFKVPCLDQDYAAGLSRWQHKICRRYARVQLNLGDSPNTWRHAKEKIADLISESLLGKRKKTHAKPARFMYSDAAKPIQPQTVDAPATASQEQNLVIAPPALPLLPRAAPRKFKPIIVDRSTQG
jgi:putative transposase